MTRKRVLRVFGGDRSSPGVHRNRGARATAKKYLAMLGIASMLSAGAVVASATAASADKPSATASASATCDGVTITASGYRAKAGNPTPNSWSISIGGQVADTGTFGESLSKKVAVPQDGQKHKWTLNIDAWDSNKDDSNINGHVGPCGDAVPDDNGGGNNGNGSEGKISFCHWTNGGHYNYLTTSLRAFYNRGHIDHQDHRDIYPAGSTNGQSWVAQGTEPELALLKAGSCPQQPQGTPRIVVAAPSASAATCDVAGRLVIPLTEHVTWKGGVDGDGPGTYRLRAKADAGYVIDGERKWTVTVEPQRTGPQCAPAGGSVTPVAPDWLDPCGADNGHWVATETTEYGYSETTNNDGSITITAFAKPGHQLAAGVTTEWTQKDSGDLCPVDLPVPDVNDPCGAGNATWVVPVDGGHITWKLLAGGDLVATADADYTFPGETSHDFGQAPETNAAACLTQVPVPAAPGVTDPCGPGNAAWVVPAKGNNVTWSLDGDGNLVATADSGYTFHGGKASHNFGKAPEANTTACPVVKASVAVAAPVLTPPTCTAAGVLTYSDHLGYTWNRTENHGDVVLTAIAKPGFTLVGQTSWSYTVAELAQLHGAKDCPPAVIPPEVEGVKNTAPPTPPVVKGVKHEAAAPLPRTGSESGLYGAAGLLLLMVGSGLVLATRQRSTQDRAH